MRLPLAYFMLAALLSAGCAHDRFRFDLHRAICPQSAPEDMTPSQPIAVPHPPQPPPLPTRSVVDQSATAAPTITPSHPEPVPATPSVITQVGSVTPAADSLAELRALVSASRQKVDAITDFECRLTKREVVAGKALPQDEIAYRFRAKPIGVYMKVLSDAGQGRELLYAAGANGNRIAVVTGKGDSAIMGTGFRTNLDVDSRDATKRSRYKITDAGFGRTVAGLERALTPAGGPATLNLLGPIRRSETAQPLVGVEVTLAPGADPLLPRGGVRRVYFGAEPGVAGHMLPILVETRDATGGEVEFYHFRDLKLPANLPAEVWDPAKLGQR